MKLNFIKLNYYNQLIKVLFKNNSPILAANILAPLGIAYFLKDFVNEVFLIFFIISQLILGLFRFYLGKKGLEYLKKNNKTAINKILKLYLLIIFLNSTLFGILSIFTVFQAEQLHVFIMLALVFGLISGAFATLSCIYHAIFLYIVPFITLFFIALLYSGLTSYYIVAITLFIYLLITIPSSYRIYITLKTNIDKANIIQKQKEEIVINQTQLIHSAKMVSMGEMIANIAHQWRQPLSSISSIASSIKLTNSLNIPMNNKELDNYMQSILYKTQYLSDTIETFRDFIKENKKFKEISLQEHIALIYQIVDASLKDNHIEFKHNLNNLDDILIKVTSGELDQVIINIINNAKDILLEKNIEKPWIKLELSKLDEKVLITIEDNGGGVPEDILPQIFDPYFSTKHQSQGTGLGLHMSYKIIEESIKGKLFVKNTKNGAKFHIEIPLITN